MLSLLREFLLNYYLNLLVQTTLLLILSSVNFRWIVTQRLPSVSYLTTLDKYAITALIFLVLLCAWHAIVGSQLLSNMDSQRSAIDFIMLYIIAGLFTAFHLVYITYFIFKYLRYSKIGKEEGDINENEKVKPIEHKRPILANNFKPSSRITSSVKPSPNIVTKVNEKEMDGVKYRNLTESPSGSITGSNMNVQTKLSQQQTNNMKY